MQRTRSLAFCALFTALIAIGAFIKISIPLEPFPMNFTLQFFFVLLAALLLGPRRACLSVGVYLVLGLIGVPIFAAGGGPGYLLRPTFGFLLGFVAAAYVTAVVAARIARNMRFFPLLLATVLGMLAYYALGMLYFYGLSNYVIHMPVTWGLVLVNCFLITLPGDFVLCLLASLLAPRLMRALRPILQ